MAELLRNFPKGPLDRYRNIASFDWKKMKIFLDTEEVIRFKEKFVKVLKGNEIMDLKDDDFKSFDEIRRNANLRTKVLKKYMNNVMPEFAENPLKFWGNSEVAYSYSPSIMIRQGVDDGLFSSLLRSLSTDDQKEVVDLIDSEQILGCFALTEVAHGSNTKSMQTRATYDKKSRQFIIHSPNFEAAKCWVGHLGQSANYAILYAQLYTPDGVCHGLHQFVVQLRDLKTHQTLPGIKIADMGRKAGLDGIDNGVVIFNNYKVSKSALLNKNMNITDDGIYVPKIKDPRRRHGAAMSTLSSGRINITCICSTLLTKAITIAIRYAAVRQQFGPENTSEELSIIEYQTHQHRLLPYLAGAMVHKVFSRYIMSEFIKSTVDKMMGVQHDDDFERGMEMHAISSASKPWAGWFGRDGIQECREACGGHGYLKASRLADLRNDNDANCTYEGENHILIQQTSNWLLKFWPMVLKRQHISSPYQSVNFLTHAQEILGLKMDADNIEILMQPEVILQIYQWLVCYLLKSSHEKQERSLLQGNGEFLSKNDNQVFYSRHLSVAYIQHFFLYRYLSLINECEDPHLKNVLLRGFSLYGIYNIEKQHMGHLYKGGYFVGDKPATLVHDAILHLCNNLKNDAVSLVDAIAPDDFLLNSVLGHSDGQVYKRLEDNIFSRPENVNRPKWWKELYTNVNAKL